MGKKILSAALMLYLISFACASVILNKPSISSKSAPKPHVKANATALASKAANQQHFQAVSKNQQKTINQIHLATNAKSTPTKNLQPLITKEPKSHSDWRKVITNGLKSIPKLQNPGQLVVFRMNAAVVTVGDKLADVLIAAAQLGKGRIVTVSHRVYADGFVSGQQKDQSVKTLQNNIKKWLAKNVALRSENVMTADVFIKTTDKNRLQSVKIVYFTETVGGWTDVAKNKILNFVKNGGGLFVAINPLAWMQQKKSGNLNLMLTYKTLLQAGIALTNSIIPTSKTFTFNKPTHLSHLQIAVNNVLSAEVKTVKYENLMLEVLSKASFLPAVVLAKFQAQIKPYLTTDYIAKIAPTKANSVKSGYIKARLYCYKKFFLNADSKVSAPKHELFPGAVKLSSNSQLVSRTYTFTAPKFKEFHHTGLYAVAGKPVTIEITSDLPKNRWTVYIGFHLDDNTQQASWQRWPNIRTYKDLTTTKTTISCAFGGLIYLESAQGSAETITIKVSNAVEAPWLNSQSEASINAWQTRKNAIGAWGCAQGKHVGFCMPRESFQKIENPLATLDTYDRVYEEFHLLRGTKPQQERKIWVIADISPAGKGIHSGYPIVTTLDYANPKNDRFMLDYSDMKVKNQLSIFYQVTRNLMKIWIPNLARQSMKYIYMMKATEEITGNSFKKAAWFSNKKATAKTYLKTPNFKTWTVKPEIGFFIFAELIDEFGWGPMKNVLSSYEKEDPKKYPKTEQARLDLFWEKYSKAVGVNLTPLLKKWGIPVTNEFTQKVKGIHTSYKAVKNIVG